MSNGCALIPPGDGGILSFRKGNFELCGSYCTLPFSIPLPEAIISGVALLAIVGVAITFAANGFPGLTLHSHWRVLIFYGMLLGGAGLVGGGGLAWRIYTLIGALKANYGPGSALSSTTKSRQSTAPEPSISAVSPTIISPPPQASPPSGSSTANARTTSLQIDLPITQPPALDQVTSSSPEALRVAFCHKLAILLKARVAKFLDTTGTPTKSFSLWNLYFTTRPQGKLATLLDQIDPLPKEHKASHAYDDSIQQAFASTSKIKACHYGKKLIIASHDNVYGQPVSCENLPLDCLAKRLERLSETQLQDLIAQLLYIPPTLPTTQQPAPGTIDRWRPVELLPENIVNDISFMGRLLLELFIDPTRLFLSDHLDSRGFLYAIRNNPAQPPIAYLFGGLHDIPYHLPILPDYVLKKYQSCQNVVLESPPIMAPQTDDIRMLFQSGCTRDVESHIEQNCTEKGKNILYLETDEDMQQAGGLSAMFAHVPMLPRMPSFSFGNERQTIAWQLGDRERFAALCVPASEPLYETSSRTQQWMTKIPGWLASSSEASPYFMLVGAAHLFDHGANQGLCSLLQTHGFSVTLETE